MLTLRSLITFAAVAIFSATAAPTAEPEASTDIAQAFIPSSEKELEARQGTHAFVKFCEHINWGGTCFTIGVTNGVCTIIPPEYNDKASSVENLSRPQWTCTWYEHNHCQGRTYSNQKDANLADGDGFFNDRITALRCTIVCDNVFC